MERFNDFLSLISGLLWGWPMIVLLLGTHIFLTIRLRFPQRHILKAIRLSVGKDKDSQGDVSQFAARRGPRRAGSRILVLADRRARNLYKIRRGTARREIPHNDKERDNTRRSDVCT